MNNQIWQYINDLGCTSLPSTISNNNFNTIYPNPAHNIVYLKNVTNYRAIEIYNATGTLINRINQPINNSLDLHEFTPGIYLVRLIDKHGVVQVKSFAKL